MNGSIIDTYTFLNTGMEMFPSVVFVNDIVTITVKNAVFIPPSTHNITSALSGNVSDLLGYTISCRTAAQIESEEFIVHFKGKIRRIGRGRGGILKFHVYFKV